MYISTNIYRPTYNGPIKRLRVEIARKNKQINTYRVAHKKLVILLLHFISLNQLPSEMGRQAQFIRPGYFRSCQ